MNAWRWAWIAMASLVAGCASTPLRFHTLVPESTPDAAAGLASDFRLQVDSVKIPAQVDRPELVTRLPDGGIAIADGDRWIAPLADELQNALSIELLKRLNGAAPAGATRQDSVAVWVNVERFEAAPNRYALIEASWRLELKAVRNHIEIACRTRAYEMPRGGYPEMVRGYQRDVVLIADQMAAVALEFSAGDPTACPGN